VLADARAALGGEEKIASVKTLTTTGRTRRVQGDNLVPIEFEIIVELPNKYLRKDEIPAQESDPSTNGFNGDLLLQIPPMTPPPARPGMPAPPPAQFEAMQKARVATLKQDFARLMLGLFASSFDGYPLTFRYIGQAEAPQGKADVLEGTGQGNFAVRFFVHSETHLPVMVSWQAAARAGLPGRGGPMAPGAAMPAGPGRGAPATDPVGRGTPPGPPPAGPPTGPPTAAPSGAPPVALPGASGGAASAPPTGSAPPAGPPENRLYFADYRDTEGLKLPFRLRRAVGTETTEETTFDRFRINAKIDPRRFEVRK
jgi:hypothetical protein